MSTKRPRTRTRASRTPSPRSRRRPNPCKSSAASGWIGLPDTLRPCPPGPLDQQLPHLITVLAQLPQAITMQISRPQASDPPEQLLEEMITCYIVMYNYTALTNFWAQNYLPDASEFDEKSEFQQLTRRIVDGSYQDFEHMAKLLGAIDPQRLNCNPLINVLVETRDL